MPDDTSVVYEEYSRILRAAVFRDEPSVTRSYSLGTSSEHESTYIRRFNFVRVVEVPDAQRAYLSRGDALLALNDRCLLESEAEIAYLLIQDAIHKRKAWLTCFNPEGVTFVLCIRILTSSSQEWIYRKLELAIGELRKLRLNTQRITLSMIKSDLHNTLARVDRVLDSEADVHTDCSLNGGEYILPFDEVTLRETDKVASLIDSTETRTVLRYGKHQLLDCALKLLVKVDVLSQTLTDDERTVSDRIRHCRGRLDHLDVGDEKMSDPAVAEAERGEVGAATQRELTLPVWNTRHSICYRGLLQHGSEEPIQNILAEAENIRRNRVMPLFHRSDSSSLCISYVRLQRAQGVHNGLMCGTVS
jgi:hypothetical protein